MFFRCFTDNARLARAGLPITYGLRIADKVEAHLGCRKTTALANTSLLDTGQSERRQRNIDRDAEINRASLMTKYKK